MRLVCVSDTHDQHEDLGVLKGDVLIHCGDILQRSNDLSQIDNWFGKQQFDLKLVIGGNHDFELQARSRDGEKDIFKNAIYLEDKAYVYKGVKFYGTPWMSSPAGWAYHLEAEDIKEKYRLIPRNTDVLITHIPPFGILDESSRGMNYGCPHLLDILKRVNPKIHCFGHVHASTGQRIIDQTVYLNNAMVGRYGLKRPTVWDFEINT